VRTSCGGAQGTPGEVQGVRRAHPHRLASFFRYADLGQDMKSRNQDAQTSHWHKSRERQDVRARDIHKSRQFNSEVSLANTEAVINRKARMKAFLIHEAAQ